MGRKPPNAKGTTRELMVEAAIKLFSRHGYDQTSFQMIADECGVSQASPVYHFRTKRGLFEAAVQSIHSHHTKIVEDLFDKRDTAYERLVKFFVGNINWFLVYRSEAQLMTLLYYFAATDVSFAKIYQSYLDKQREEIESFLLAGEREGLFHSPFLKEKPAVLSQILYESLIGIGVNLLAGNARQNKPLEIQKKVKKTIETLAGYEENKAS